MDITINAGPAIIAMICVTVLVVTAIVHIKA